MREDVRIILFDDSYSSYVAARAFLIIAQIYLLPLILVPVVLLCKRLFNQLIFCALILTGISLFIWLIVVAAITTSVFHDNCVKHTNCMGWSASVIWVCLVLSILLVGLPICMFCTGKRIDEMKSEDVRQNYEPINETAEAFDVTVTHHE